MRVFVAAEVPEDIRSGLSRIQTALSDLGLRQLRWVESSKIHLTLRFCGEMAPEATQRLSTALSDPAPVAAFRVRLERLQFLPPRGSPRVLVLSLAESDPLQRLAGWIDRAAQAVGVEKEERPYRPHLTLGRFRSGGRSPHHLRPAEFPKDMAGMEFLIEGFQILQSRLGAGGPSYTVLGEFSLPAGGSA